MIVDPRWTCLRQLEHSACMQARLNGNDLMGKTCKLSVQRSCLKSPRSWQRTPQTFYPGQESRSILEVVLFFLKNIYIIIVFFLIISFTHDSSFQRQCYDLTFSEKCKSFVRKSTGHSHLERGLHWVHLESRKVGDALDSDHLRVHLCPFLVLLLVISQLLQGFLQLCVLSLQTLLQLLVALQKKTSWVFSLPI